MKCRFPVAEVDGITIAILLAETFKEHLGLILHPAANHELQDPSLNLYCVGWLFEVNSQTNRFCRLAYLGNDLYNLRFRGKTLAPTWREIYICDGSRVFDRADPAAYILACTSDRAVAPFRVPRWLINGLHTLGLLHYNGPPWDPQNMPLQTWMYFEDLFKFESIRIALGICDRGHGEAQHWAHAEEQDLETWDSMGWV